MTPEGSLPCSQEPTTGLRPQLDNSYNHGHPLHFFKLHFNITLSTSRFSRWSFPFRFTYQNCETVCISPPFHDHIRSPGMELSISNQLSSPASLSIKMPSCYRGFSPAHSHIKPSRSPPDDPNPPIHIPPHKQILRELPCALKPPHS